ncbi:MAG: FkbM family methyltransferase [Candidatus Njordarchaeales archaeon]
MEKNSINCIKSISKVLESFIASLPFVIVPTSYGIFITPPASPKAQMLGTYEPTVSQIIKSSLETGDIFIDVGAHAGYYTLMCARLAKKVIAFEPNPINYKFLYFNILLNRLKNVVAVKAAVSDFDGYGELNVPYQKGKVLTSQSSLIHRGERTFNVRVVTLDKILDSIHITQPFIIKIDVEGAELNVIKGALRTLSKGVKLVIIETHSTYAKNSIVELLKTINYRVSIKNKYVIAKRN